MTWDYILNRKRTAIRSITTKIIIKGVYCSIHAIELYFGLVTAIWILFKKLWQKTKSCQNEYCLTVGFLLCWGTYRFLLNIPANVITNLYAVQQKHPLTTISSSVLIYLWDTVAVVVFGVFVVYMKGRMGKFYYMFISLVEIACRYILLVISFHLLLPISEEHEKLPDGPVRDNITKLAKSQGFNMEKFVVANTYGIANHDFNAYTIETLISRRIVLSKRFLIYESEGKISVREICAIVAHELNHWKKSHSLLSQLELFVNVFITNYIALGLPSHFDVFYFRFPQDERPIMAAYTYAINYCSLPFVFTYKMISLCISRLKEIDSDNFAACLGFAKDLIKALVKITIWSYSFPLTDPIYASRYFTHPPLLERVRNLQNYRNTTYF